MLSIIFFFFYLEMNSFIVTSPMIWWLLVPAVPIILYVAYNLIYALERGEKIIPAELEELHSRSFTFIFAHDHR